MNKEELVDFKKDFVIQGLSFYHLILALSILLFTSILIGTKVFLTTEIYRSSRSINNLLAQYQVLLEEKKRLENELEVVRSKYLILNPAE